MHKRVITIYMTMLERHWILDRVGLARMFLNRLIKGRNSYIETRRKLRGRDGHKS